MANTVGIGVERGGGGDAGVFAAVRGTDCGLDGLGESFALVVRSRDGAAGVKKAIGVEKIPADVGGPAFVMLGVMGEGLVEHMDTVLPT